MIKNAMILATVLGIFLFPITDNFLASAADEIDAVAHVNGVPISTEIFEKRMRRLVGEGQGDFDSYEGKIELLDILIAREVLNQEGKALGLDKSAMVKERVDELVEGLVVNEMVNVILEKKITPEAMQQYYTKNKVDFREIRASHILLKTEDEATDIKKKLEAGGDFSALAKEASIDPASAQRGGDLDFFVRERMPEAFAEAAFAMKKNEISEPVKSAFGYHIIQVVDMRDPVAFESLSQAQLQNLRGTMVNWEIDKLREKAKVTIHDARLREAASRTQENAPAPAEEHGH